MRLYSRTIGTGPPLIILHGLFGMSDNWMTIAKRLSQEGFSVHLLDLRNHGRSPHMETHSYQDMYDDILFYLDCEKLEKVGLIGHSMGGKVAMYLALLRPERISNLVVIDIAPVTYCCHEGSLHAIIVDQLMEMDLTAYKNQTAIMAEMERRLKDRPLVMFLGKNIKRESGGYAWKLNLPVLKKYLPALYAGPQDLDAHAPSPVSTLFVKGNLSHYIQPQHDPDRLRYFPKSHVVGIDAGHWLHAEQPEKTLGHLTDFLATDASR